MANEIVERLTEAAEKFRPQRAAPCRISKVVKGSESYFVEGSIGESHWRPSFEIRVKVETKGELTIVRDIKVHINWPATGELSPTEAVAVARLHRELAEAACEADTIVRRIPEVVSVS